MQAQWAQYPAAMFRKPRFPWLEVLLQGYCSDVSGIDSLVLIGSTPPPQLLWHGCAALKYSSSLC